MLPRNQRFVHALSASFPEFISGGQTLPAMAYGGPQIQVNGYHLRGPGLSIMDCRQNEFIRTPPNYPFKKVFRVMSYNVLSDNLCQIHSELYTSCQREALDFGYRKRKIIDEILKFRPSIVCLQEVDEEYFQSFYLHELSKNGYDGEFVRRTDANVDGVAIFYKKIDFKLLEWKPVEYFVSKTAILNRGNVGMVMALQPVEYKELRLPTRVCVANTHLLFNMKRGDIKLAQLAYLLANLHQIAQKPDQPAGSYYPSFLCGDLNSTPNSDLCTFIKSGYINYAEKDKYYISGQIHCYPQTRRSFIPASILPPFLSHRCTLLPAATSFAGTATNPSDDRLSATGSSKRDRSPSNSQSEASKTKKSDILAFPQAAAARNEPEVSDSVFSSEAPSAARSSNQFCNMSASTSRAAQPGQDEPWGELRHQFKFCSSYKHTIDRYGYYNVPGVTTMHHGQAGLKVDHIFYAGSKPPQGRYNLLLLNRYGLVSEQEISAAGHIPNMEVPSDHLPIVAEFCLTK
ncbi:protein angel homolog 1-like [Watersipora subatra]|uniref:protein angel homolog 1-like n=1 Tax=Watersipora subatra TaxID=2589382 RepID=UPI00355C9463